MFRVGQKVVCVDDVQNDPRCSPEMHGLQSGRVYTIRWIGIFLHPAFNEENLCVHLREITRPAGFAGVVVPFLATRFRPIVEKKTDISIFEEILRRETVKDSERARA